MKILLSAYACEPNKGSEPGVGWNWAQEIINLGHQVWVITRCNNKPIIERYYDERARPKDLHFIYYDVPKWLSWWKKGGHGIRVYYLLWQIGGFFKAKKKHKEINFDLVHHITFGVVRQPSFMGMLKIPFILGPLGGGERAPYALRAGYPVRGKILDFTRDVLNRLIFVDPFMMYTFQSASKIYVKTPESKSSIPVKFHKKTKVQIEIGIDPIAFQSGENDIDKNEIINLLYVGRFIYWKGAHLGLLAFKKVINERPNIRLTMVGKGPEEIMWKNLVEEKKHAINWISWVNQDELKEIYCQHDALLFPSLHDSSGNVILEALNYGLPVICLNLGGPGVIVDNKCGIKVEVSGLNVSQVVDQLCSAILSLVDNPEYRIKLRKGAVDKARSMSWANAVRSIYQDYEIK